jgi:hypothetical protein
LKLEWTNKNANVNLTTIMLISSMLYIFRGLTQLASHMQCFHYMLTYSFIQLVNNSLKVNFVRVDSEIWTMWIKDGENAVAVARAIS